MLHRVVLLTPEVVVVYLSLCGGGRALHSPAKISGAGVSVLCSHPRHTGLILMFLSGTHVRMYSPTGLSKSCTEHLLPPPPLFEVHRLAGLVWRGGNVSTWNPYDT